MFSPRSLSVLSIACVALIVLLFTSKRLAQWPLDGPLYHTNRYSLSTAGLLENRPAATYSAAAGDGDGDGESGDRKTSPSASRGGYDTTNDPLCASFPDASGILLVMKTGASESFARVPTQLMTTLGCLADFLVFSDLGQDMAGFEIYDSLDTVSANIRDSHPDFDIYRRQRTCAVDQESCARLGGGDPATEGWNLDKYKNIHMAAKAYRMRPDYSWYVFVDADSYVVWPNLVRWLARLQPWKKLYAGSVSLINDFPFAHGGSGYVLSQAAMADFVGRHPAVATRYDERASHECCGDFVLAHALTETTGIQVQQAWPSINGEKPHTMPFGPTHWCHPLITMHHMNSEEISSFWQFEGRRQRHHNKTDAAAHPLVMKDVFTEFVHPKIRDVRDNWDNLSDDVFYVGRNATTIDSWKQAEFVRKIKNEADMNELEKRAHLSFDDCRAACASVGDECFQFQYNGAACGFSHSIRLGGPVEKQDGPGAIRTMSGWDLDKIDRWVNKQRQCNEVQWPLA